MRSPSGPPEVSVIIAVHNGSALIGSALESLARQYEDPSRVEVVVIDDGSTDDTFDVVMKYAPRLPKLVVERLAQNQGPGSAKNRGLEISSAPIVTFLDADDWYQAGRLPALVHALDELGVNHVRTDLVHAHIDGKRTVASAPYGRRGVPVASTSGILPADASTMVDYPYMPAGAYRRELVDSGILKYSDNLYSAEDRALAWRLYLHGGEFAVVRAPAMLYRRGRAESLTQVFDWRQMHFLLAFREIIELVNNHQDSDVYLPKAVRQFLAISEHHVERSTRQSRKYRKELGRGIEQVAATIPDDHLGKVWEGTSESRKRNLKKWIGTNG